MRLKLELNSTNMRLSRREFSSGYSKFTETLLCYIHLRVLLLLTINRFFFFQNKHATLAENGKNLISAQPRISAHSQGPKI